VPEVDLDKIKFYPPRPAELSTPQRGKFKAAERSPLRQAGGHKIHTKKLCRQGRRL